MITTHFLQYDISRSIIYNFIFINLWDIAFFDLYAPVFNMELVTSTATVFQREEHLRPIDLLVIPPYHVGQSDKAKIAKILWYNLKMYGKDKTVKEMNENLFSRA